MDSPFSHLTLLLFALSLSFYASIAQPYTPYRTYANEDPNLMATSSIPPPAASSPCYRSLHRYPDYVTSFPPHYGPRVQDPIHIPPRSEIEGGRPMRSPPNHHFRHKIHLPPPPPPHGMNPGKKLGLFFVGIAAILQVGIVGFLVIKRRQLLKSIDGYETSF